MFSVFSRRNRRTKRAWSYLHLEPAAPLLVGEGGLDVDVRTVGAPLRRPGDAARPAPFAYAGGLLCSRASATLSTGRRMLAIAAAALLNDSAPSSHVLRGAGVPNPTSLPTVDVSRGASRFQEKSSMFGGGEEPGEEPSEEEGGDEKRSVDDGGWSFFAFALAAFAFAALARSAAFRCASSAALDEANALRASLARHAAQYSTSQPAS